MSVDYVAVLRVIRPEAEWSVGESYETLVWLDESAKPSQQECDAAWPDVSVMLAWQPVREKRDGLLAGSDWTQVADAPVDQQAWAAYRQQLRDIPQNFDSPDDVVWPEAP